VNESAITQPNARSWSFGEALWLLAVAPIAGYLSPVPGGVGPMTITMLLRNTVTAARLSIGS